jgi:hypothetical protein
VVPVPDRGDHAPVDLTEDSFRALARSSPWRWSTLHFTHKDDGGEVEAWVRRPGRLRVRAPGRPDTFESGVPYSQTTVWASDDPNVVPPPEPEHRTPQDASPLLRPDGLVAERPSDWDIDYDDPMYQNFIWVEMLDPVELSHHVAVSDLRVDEVAGRPVWRALLRAEEGYEPRCGGNCCELLYSDVSRRCESEDPAEWYEAPPPGTYPDVYDVALDVQTGIVVQLTPVGGRRDDLAFSNTILKVDADLDAMFPV